MRFRISRTSNAGGIGNESPAPGATRASDTAEWHIDLADLDALVRLIDLVDEPLILSRRHGVGGPTAIEVYDDLREEFR